MNCAMIMGLVCGNLHQSVLLVSNSKSPVYNAYTQHLGFRAKAWGTLTVVGVEPNSLIGYPNPTDTKSYLDIGPRPACHQCNITACTRDYHKYARYRHNLYLARCNKQLLSYIQLVLTVGQKLCFFVVVQLRHRGH